jgi:hypothetical protein
MCTSLSNVHMRGRKKTITREKSLIKATKGKKYIKKKSYGQAHVIQEGVIHLRLGNITRLNAMRQKKCAREADAGGTTFETWPPP